MRAVFEELYNASRTRHSPYMVPEYLRDDPMRARSQYAFQRGALGIQIAFTCFEAEYAVPSGAQIKEGRAKTPAPLA